MREKKVDIVGAEATQRLLETRQHRRPRAVDDGVLTAADDTHPRHEREVGPRRHRPDERPEP